MKNVNEGVALTSVGATLIAGAVFVQSGVTGALLCFGVYCIILGIVKSIKNSV